MEQPQLNSQLGLPGACTYGILSLIVGAPWIHSIASRLEYILWTVNDPQFLWHMVCSQVYSISNLTGVQVWQLFSSLSMPFFFNQKNLSPIYTLAMGWTNVLVNRSSKAKLEAATELQSQVCPIFLQISRLGQRSCSVSCTLELRQRLFVA